MSQLHQVKLKRSCFTCINSKRKCDKALPNCGRCSRLGKGCSYQNEPTTFVVAATTAPTQSAYQSSHWSEKSPSKTNSGLYGVKAPEADIVSLSLVTPGLGHLQLETPHVLMKWDTESCIYLADQLRSAPESLLNTGGTLFIHPKLYASGLPPLLQQICSICSIYSKSAVATQYVIDRAIDDAGAALLLASKTMHTFPAMLEFVQSLILLQIISLLWPGLNALRWQQAERRLGLLSTWSYKLYNATPSSLPSSFVSTYRV